MIIQNVRALQFVLGVSSVPIKPLSAPCHCLVQVNVEISTGRDFVKGENGLAGVVCLALYWENPSPFSGVICEIRNRAIWIYTVPLWGQSGNKSPEHTTGRRTSRRMDGAVIQHQTWAEISKHIKLFLCLRKCLNIVTYSQHQADISLWTNEVNISFCLYSALWWLVKQCHTDHRQWGGNIHTIQTSFLLTTHGCEAERLTAFPMYRSHYSRQAPHGHLCTKPICRSH